MADVEADLNWSSIKRIGRHYGQEACLETTPYRVFAGETVLVRYLVRYLVVNGARINFEATSSNYNCTASPFVIGPVLQRRGTTVYIYGLEALALACASIVDFNPGYVFSRTTSWYSFPPSLCS